MLPFAIQLYSVRDHWVLDPLATYRGLKDAGYDYVELFAVGPDNVDDHNAMLADAGLAPMCAHLDYETVTANTEAAIQVARTLGIKYVVMPWIEFDSAAGWENAAKGLAEAGARFREAGLKLGYHNHDHEFRNFGGRTAFEIIVDAAPADDLFIELDAYWANEGGEDAIGLIRTLGSRCPLLHLKDKPTAGDVPFTEIGSGMTDWPAVFEAARTAGVEWYIVEQDESERDTLESAAISAEFMRRQ